MERFWKNRTTIRTGYFKLHIRPTVGFGNSVQIGMNHTGGLRYPQIITLTFQKGNKFQFHKIYAISSRSCWCIHERTLLAANCTPVERQFTHNRDLESTALNKLCRNLHSKAFRKENSKVEGKTIHPIRSKNSKFTPLSTSQSWEETKRNRVPNHPYRSKANLSPSKKGRKNEIVRNPYLSKAN